MIENNSPTRRLLFVGFGGLLLLLTLAGLNAISVVHTIEDRNDRIRREYLARERTLEQLRSDVYLSGTYVRDFLLEPNAGLVDQHRKEFETARIRIQAISNVYAHIVLPEERLPFQRFLAELNRYFESLEPALHWSPAERKKLGYSFTERSLLPRRLELVRLSNQLSALNQQQLEAGGRQVKDLFAGFQRSLLLILVLSVCAGVVLAVASIYRLLRLERISALRLQEVLQARTDLRDLSTRLVEVQESERRALSRELHDEVGQSVSGLLLGLGNVAASLSPAENAGAIAQLNELRRLAEKTVAVVRDLSLLLRPSMLDDLGLLPALQWQAREISRTKNVAVQVFADESLEEALSEEQRTCVYRVVQEALQNVVRHAAARSVEIRLSEDSDKRLVLVIQDDGQGFVPAREKGVGLLGMEERVHHLKGSFSLSSQPSTGTTIRVVLPLAELSRRRE